MKIPEIPIISRDRELNRFQEEARDIVQGRGEDLFFLAPRGTGKTALLKKVREQLFWNDSGLIPVYFSFSRPYNDLLEFSEDYLVSLLSQFLLSEQKERLALRLEERPTFSTLQKEAEQQGKDGVGEIIRRHQRAFSLREESKGLVNALSAPLRLAQSAGKPIWMLLDHIQALESPLFTNRGLLGLWRTMLGNPWVPHFFSGEPPGGLLKYLLPGFFPCTPKVWECPPLPLEAGTELFRALNRRYPVQWAEDLVSSWFGFLDCNPGLLTAFLRDARLFSPGLESHRRFLNAYLKSLQEGELGRWFAIPLSAFHRTLPGERKGLLLVLHLLWKTGETPIPWSEMQEISGLPARNLQSLIEDLERLGWVREAFGGIQLEPGQVLRDWVEVLVRKHLHLQDPKEITAQMVERLEELLTRPMGEESETYQETAEGLSFQLILPLKQDVELVAVGALEQIAGFADLDRLDLEKLKQALIEVCINALEHSRADKGKIRIQFLVRPKVISITVEDRGQAFDPLAIQSLALRPPEETGRSRGHGLLLIKEWMDEVRFEKTPFGTRVVMVKKTRKGHGT